MSVTTVAIREGTFKYQGRVYPYLDAPYNSTRVNERAVEVPIALDLVNGSGITLEVGAVLPHYIPDWPGCGYETIEHPGYTCIDLHEDYPGVANDDVLLYQPRHRYYLIICISTLDHLQNADEVKTAVSRMKSWLMPDGLLFVSLPHGQPSEIGGGPWLDELVLSGELEMNITRMDKVDPVCHTWQERPLTDPPRPYNGDSHFANTVYLMEWRR